MWRKTVINLAGKKSSYLPKETPSDVKDLLSYYLPVLHYVDDLHPIPDDEFFKVTLLVPKDLTVTIQSEINTLFADYQLTATSSGSGCIDVIPSHVHKGTGIDFLLDYWGYGQKISWSLGTAAMTLKCSNWPNIPLLWLTPPTNAKKVQNTKRSQMPKTELPQELTGLSATNPISKQNPKENIKIIYQK